MKHYFAQNYDFNDSKLVSVIDEVPLWSAPFGLTLLENILVKPKMKVLDIGCGTGFPLIELAQRLGTSSFVYGIDPWEKAIERTEEKLKIYDVSNVKTLKGQAEELPFANNFFDLITSNNGLNNVEDVQKVFAEISRVAKRNSQLIFTYNLPGTMKEFYDIYRLSLKELKLESLVKNIDEHIFHKRKPVAFYKKILKDNGYCIQKAIYKKFNFNYLDGTTMLNHFFIRLAFIESWEGIVPLNKIKVVFETIEKKLNGIAKKYGKLVLTIPYVCLDCKKEK